MDATAKTLPTTDTPSDLLYDRKLILLRAAAVDR